MEAKEALKGLVAWPNEVIIYLLASWEFSMKEEEDTM